MVGTSKVLVRGAPCLSTAPHPISLAGSSTLNPRVISCCVYAALTFALTAVKLADRTIQRWIDLLNLGTSLWNIA